MMSTSIINGTSSTHQRGAQRVVYPRIRRGDWSENRSGWQNVPELDSVGCGAQQRMHDSTKQTEISLEMRFRRFYSMNTCNFPVHIPGCYS